MRALRSIVALLLLLPPVVGPGPAGGQERIVSKRDADRIFGLSRSQWEAEARAFVPPRGWNVRLQPATTGTSVIATDPRTGTGLGVQPSFRNAQGPPELLVVSSYYPAGTLRRYSEQMRREMETAAAADLGAAYVAIVAFSEATPAAAGFDVVEVIITRVRR
jgi:hypothetical protein